MRPAYVPSFFMMMMLSEAGICVNVNFSKIQADQGEALVDTLDSLDYSWSHHLLSYFLSSESSIFHIRGNSFSSSKRSRNLGAKWVELCVSCVPRCTWEKDTASTCQLSCSITYWHCQRGFECYSPSAKDLRRGKEWIQCCLSPICLMNHHLSQRNGRRNCWNWEWWIKYLINIPFCAIPLD